MNKPTRVQLPTRLTLAISGSTPLNDAEVIFAQQCGMALAEHGGYKLVFGACPGTPEALVQSFLKYRRNPRLHKVTGISPYRSGHRHRRGGDPLLTGVEMQYSGIGWARNGLLVEHGHALVAFGGRWGTLSELIFAAQLRRPVLVPRMNQSTPSAVMAFQQAMQILREVPGANEVQLLIFETASHLLEQLGVVHRMLAEGKIPPPKSW